MAGVLSKRNTRNKVVQEDVRLQSRCKIANPHCVLPQLANWHQPALLPLLPVDKPTAKTRILSLLHTNAQLGEPLDKHVQCPHDKYNLLVGESSYAQHGEIEL